MANSTVAERNCLQFSSRASWWASKTGVRRIAEFTEPRLTKLELFMAYIERRIEEAKPDWIPAPPMLRSRRWQVLIAPFP